MTPAATAAPTRRLVLVAAPPRGGQSEEVRRYRLARLRLEDRDVARAERFAHCKRSYD